MAEATPASAPTPIEEVPKQVCEKCRNQFPLDHFDHKVAGQECVCRRCLAVMGYKV
jgi:hypothetical protein